MRYLVTGGAGFIGSHLVEHLVGRGEDVVVLDDFSTGSRKNIEPFAGKIELIEGSILDEATCARAVRDVDYVLHEAAIPSVPRSVVDPVGSHAVNVTGTLNILIAARDAKVRKLVYAASSSAYGDTVELPKHESMIPRPLSPYAAAKYAGECYCKVFHATYGLPTVALRYFNIFGPRQDPNSQYAAVIAKFAQCAIRAEAPTIYGDGGQTRDFTYVANVVSANMLACTAPDSANGEVFNVGCGDRITVNDLWRRISAAAGFNGKANYAPARAGDVRDSLASLDKIRQGIGYKPLIDLDEGLKRTLDFFRGQA
jgi:nucleoside-diphosphate-sugar epimerase